MSLRSKKSLEGSSGGGARRILREGALSSLLCVVGKRNHHLETERNENDFEESSCNRSVAFIGDNDRETVEMIVNDDDSSVLSTKIDPDRIRWQTTWMLTDMAAVSGTRQSFPQVLPFKAESRHDEDEDQDHGLTNKTNFSMPKAKYLPPPCDMVRVNSLMQDSQDDDKEKGEEDDKITTTLPTPPRASLGKHGGGDDIPLQVTVPNSPKAKTKILPDAPLSATWMKTILKPSSSSLSNNNGGTNANQNKPRRVVTWRLPLRSGSSIPSIRTNSTSQFSSELSDSLYGFDIDDEWEDALLQASMLDCHALLCDDDF